MGRERRSALYVLLLGAGALAGCATSKGDEVPDPIVAAQSAEGEFAIGALTDAALPKGECGMILWTLDIDRPAPIFRFIANKGGEIVLNGEPMTLSLTETAGASGFGVYEEQSLAAPGLAATVKVRFGLGFDGGTYLERGLLTVETDSGWRSVIPAAGIAGCRRK